MPFAYFCLLSTEFLGAYFPTGGIVRSADPCVPKLSEPSREIQVETPFTNGSISFAVCGEDNLDWYMLHPLEEQALGEAVSEKRRRDFRVGRAAARCALERAAFPVVTPPTK